MYEIEKGPWETINPVATDLVKQLLNINPKERPTAKEALGHQWF
jgi:serine/threonine protein kinase